MAEFKAFSRKVEVKGAAVLSIVEGIRSAGTPLTRSQALHLLEESGILPLQQDVWYPQQQVLDALRAIFNAVGRESIRAIGRKIPEVAEFPTGIDTIGTALQAIDVAHRMNHRGAVHLGSYRYEQLAPQQAHLACHTPYPCDLDLGLVEGTVRRFAPRQGIDPTVDHLPGKCRNQGDLSCTYGVRW